MKKSSDLFLLFCLTIDTRINAELSDSAKISILKETKNASDNPAPRGAPPNL